MTNVEQGKRDWRQTVSEAPSYRVGDRVSVRIVRRRRHMQYLGSCRLIEFLGSNMCAGADTGGSKLGLTWLRLRRRNEPAGGGDTSRLACDEYVGLARERNDRNEILQRVVREVLQERRTMPERWCLSGACSRRLVTSRPVQGPQWLPHPGRSPLSPVGPTA